VLAVAVLGGAIAGAVSVGRAAGQAMNSQGMNGQAVTGQATTGQTPAPVQPKAPVDPAGLGHDLTLNAYAARCYDGHMQACDDLYDDSAPMSRYEQYGMTCGGRVKPFDVDYCTELG
jgi:hypothetical protein